MLNVAFRAEYNLKLDGVTYSINPANTDDIVLVDTNPTEAISQAVGMLASQLNNVWRMKSDKLKIYRFT